MLAGRASELNVAHQHRRQGTPMRLTGFTDYSIRTLLYLALLRQQPSRSRRHATIADIALAYNVSVNHLVKVVAHLRTAGHVETLRGQHGGIWLARAPSAINLGAVVRRTEPDMRIAPCFEGGEGCRIHGGCEASNILAEATQAFLAVLDRYTLADLLSGPHQKLGLLLGMSPAGYPVAVALPNATEMAWDNVGPSGSSPAP